VIAVSVPSAVVVDGIVNGLLYGLVALGLVLVYRTNRVLNFAQGQMGVVGAVFLVKAKEDWGFNYFFAAVLAIALSASMGALSEITLRRLFNRPRVLVMVATIGLSQLLYYFASLPFIAPKHLGRAYPLPISTTFTIGNVVFGPAAVMVLVVAPVVALSLAAFIKWSPWGLAMRAMSENIDSARLSGVWVRRTSTLTWTLAGVISAFAAILYAPGQQTALTQPLSSDLLIYALLAALIGAMVNLTVAFIAGIGVGVLLEILNWNISSPAAVATVMFALLLAVLLVRIAALQRGPRTGEQSTWQQGAVTTRPAPTGLRRMVGTGGLTLTWVVVALLPLVLGVGQNSQLANVCIYALVALSLTILTGWAGQVSLGQLGFVGVGVLMAAHLGGSMPLPLLMLLAGAVTAVVTVVVGLPALRVRGLYLAVTTLGFALWMQVSVLPTSCFTLPLVGKRLCTGLPDASNTVVANPSVFGINLSSARAFAWFSLVILGLSILMVRRWRDHGVARRLVAVRDNETGAAAMGIPVLRTKILAFALSGFIAGYAGVCFAFSLQNINATGNVFDPSYSLLVVSMVVIGGLGSVSGAVLGAIYLEGLTAIFGTSSTIEFLTSGLGVVAFILYLPGGLAEIMHRLGDVVTMGIERWRRPPLAGGDAGDGGDVVTTAPDRPDPAPAVATAGAASSSGEAD
jgi:ABC-type branched-subunit amino acid transport system permease subunit